MTQEAKAALEQTLFIQVEDLIDTLAAIENEEIFNEMVAKFLTPELTERLSAVQKLEVNEATIEPELEDSKWESEQESKEEKWPIILEEETQSINAILQEAMKKSLEREWEDDAIEQQNLLHDAPCTRPYPKTKLQNPVDVRLESSSLRSDLQWLWWLNQHALVTGSTLIEVFWSRQSARLGVSRSLTARFECYEKSLPLGALPFDPFDPSKGSICVKKVMRFGDAAPSKNIILARILATKFFQKATVWLEDKKLEREYERKIREVRVGNVRGIE